ncbi:response regulator NasT [Parvibaculum indicum]|uniref:ANTAR domain-containing response regulator n=1 Tax=Parvibaculum indicum TaxID=562969 RepID=UPI0014247665|nr:ANTAR domain-containing protein [Parvibaculum indicum]NIJ40654.1 response regulator NasT [Parvibaculum indicum]
MTAQEPDTSRPLKILIIDSNDERAAVVESGLSDYGDAQILRVGLLTDLARQVEEIQPDVIFVDVDSPDRDTLESMRNVSDIAPRPIVMFVEESEASLAEEALRAGVSAYIVDGLSAKRVKPILDVAILRFKVFQTMREELDRAKSDLASRKTIERAKGLLMQQRNVTEEEAYKLLRTTAMKEGKPILEIADNLISIARLLKG